MTPSMDRSVLVDTSALIEFLNDGHQAVADEVERVLATHITTCDAVVMELTAGARSESDLQSIKSLLAMGHNESVTSVDFEIAATLYRTARRSGVTVRSMLDCVIAAVAVRLGIPILHNDRDFDALASCTEVRIHSY